MCLGLRCNASSHDIPRRNSSLQLRTATTIQRKARLICLIAVTLISQFCRQDITTRSASIITTLYLALSMVQIYDVASREQKPAERMGPRGTIVSTRLAESQSITSSHPKQFFFLARQAKRCCPNVTYY